MKNKISDLNNHLFAALERLSDEELTEEQMELETKRSKAITEVSKCILNSAKITLQAASLVAKGHIKHESLPPSIDIKNT